MREMNDADGSDEGLTRREFVVASAATGAVALPAFGLAEAVRSSAPPSPVDLLVVESGEQSKSVETAAWLWQKLLELGTGRKSLIVAVGGGVVGDLAGFVARCRNDF